MFDKRKNSENIDAAQLLYSNLMSGLFVTIFAASYLVFNFKTPETTTFKWIWFSIFCLIILARAADFYRWSKRDKNSVYYPEKAVLRTISGTLITAVMLAVYTVYTLNYSSNIETSVIILTMSALSGGAASVLSAHKVTAILYPIILLVPASISLHLSANEYQNYFGVLGLAFCAAITAIASKSSDFTSLAIQLKNENTNLINTMEDKVARRTETIYQLSNIDPLTGLYNRSAFMHKLSEQLEYCKRNNLTLALLFIDLDGFKKINDTLGHNIGDKLLKLTATRIKEQQDNNPLVCRWGGDEFLVAYTNTDEKLAHLYGTQLIEHITEQYQIDNTTLFISATIGLSLFPEHTLFTDNLIQFADTAMYVQKKKHPGLVKCFDHIMSDNIQRENKLKTGLMLAISKNQLRIVYQPIICAQSGRVVAFESLLRWTLEEEEISPVEFIALAEQYGSIYSIGNWVLQQSCLAAAKWCSGNQQKSPRVSVNVSILQLNKSDFIPAVKNILSASKLNGNKLIIEITESIFAEDKETVLKRVRQLQAMGVKVSIDDFGSEYSSLSVVQNLAADTIKIDREFIKSIDNGGLAIIKAVKEIAEKFNYLVIAEGVETQEQAELITSLGVDMLQGFYYSKPMEADCVDSYLQTTRQSYSKVNAVSI